MKVEVFSAGDHFHSDPKGSEQLIEMLLRKSGYTREDLTWKVRIDKMLHCSPETPPIKVVGFKEFGVYLRVKPQPNATINHQMTLLIPDDSGYKAANLFSQLKGVQKSISRKWREEYRESRKSPETKHSIPVVRVEEPAPMPATIVEAPKPILVEISRPEFNNLKAIAENREKLIYVLNKINSIPITSNKDEFISRLQAECEWEEYLPRIVTRVMTDLSRKGFICEITDDKNKVISYALAPRGTAIMAGKEDPGPTLPDTPGIIIANKEPSPIEKVAKKRPDLGLLLREFTSKAQEIADIGRKLEAIEVKRNVLRTELKTLDEEYERLAATIEKENVWGAVEDLNSFYQESPVQA